jgi:Sulfatase-modifying factor enzyme 1
MNNYWRSTLCACLVGVVWGAGTTVGAPAPKPAPAQSITNSLGMKLVAVPGSTALFCAWPTRVQDFAAFVKATNYEATNYMWSLHNDSVKVYGDSWKCPGFPQEPSHPVVGVSWKDAKAFCQWLTEKERREKVIGPKQSYRLPTLPEWMAALGAPCKCASDKKKAGASLSNWRVFSGSEAGKTPTAPVESAKPNPIGLSLMDGSVFQWGENRYVSDHKGQYQDWFRAGPGGLLLACTDILPEFRIGFSGFRVVLVNGEASREPVLCVACEKGPKAKK